MSSLPLEREKEDQRNKERKGTDKNDLVHLVVKREGVC